MSLLLETTLGDIVIDLDVDGSPKLCQNVLKLAKARYYTSSLIYNVQPHRFCQFGDPVGDGSGGACIYGLLDKETVGGDVTKSKFRFLKSSMGRVLTQEECREKGRVVATEINGIADTIGSQLLMTIDGGQDYALDGFQSLLGNASTTAAAANNELMAPPSFRSVGRVVEDENNVLDQIAATYCDANGRPYADIRIIRALIIDDPFEDPQGMKQLMKNRGVVFEDDTENDNKINDDDDDDDKIIASPEYERPPEEEVEIRIQADQIDPEEAGEEDIGKLRQQQEELLQREDKSRAVVLEMLGDLPSADITAPENVLFVCKLNPVTEDEDLELIFSRFDERVKAEIIRDNETGSSLQYAFVEFSSKEQAAEAYFKMNNALVDDRRIKVDFSQSVAKVWDRFNQRQRGGGNNKNRMHMPPNPFSDATPHGAVRGDRGRERGHGGSGRGDDGNRSRHEGGRSQRHSHRDEEDLHHRHRDHRGRDCQNQSHSNRYQDVRHEDRHRNQSSRQHDNNKQHKDNDAHGLHRRDGHRRHRSKDRGDDRGERYSYRREENRDVNERNNDGDGDRDEFGRLVQTGQMSFPKGHRRFDSDQEEDSNSSDDKHRRHGSRRRRHSRSRSRDRTEKKHKKQKRKRSHRDDSRERKHKKHHRKEPKRRSGDKRKSSASS